jgi:hypothetical protein
VTRSALAGLIRWKPSLPRKFNGIGENFFHQEDFKGRVILVRYVWLNAFSSVNEEAPARYVVGNSEIAT